MLVENGIRHIADHQRQP